MISSRLSRGARRRRRALSAAAGRVRGAAAAGLLAFVLGASHRQLVGRAAARRRLESAGPIELPRGGRSLLPEYRLVGFYGAPQDEALGALGVGTPAEASERLLEQAKAYEGGKPVMPVSSSSRLSPRPPREGRALPQPPAALGDQGVPGRGSPEQRHPSFGHPAGAGGFAGEVRRLERYLDEPDVGLALDPEWHVGPDEIPGEVIGSVSASEVNQIAEGLAATVERLDLPEKLLVIHQFTDEMITSKALLIPQDGLATVLNVDGFGDPPNKIAKYRRASSPRCDRPGVGA